MDEFMELFGEWGLDVAGQPIPLSVEPYLGAGANGGKFGPALSRPGLPQMPQDRVIVSSTGDEETSSTAIYAPLSMAGDFPLGSRVTLRSGRVARVLGHSEPDTFGLFGFVIVSVT